MSIETHSNKKYISKKRKVSLQEKRERMVTKANKKTAMDSVDIAHAYGGKREEHYQAAHSAFLIWQNSC